MEKCLVSTLHSHHKFILTLWSTTTSMQCKKMLENYVELLEAMLYGAEKFQYETNCNT